MDRRTLLKYLAAAPILSQLSPNMLAFAEAGLKKSRVRVGDRAWPNAAAWDQFKKQIGGHLIPVQSPLPAYKTAIEDPNSLKGLLADLHNPFYLGDQPGITQTFGWVDAWTTAPSIYAVAAESAQDIAAGVNFAREHNLRLVVKGGGHSYQGTSCAPDSLLIWTRHLNDIVLHQDFVPQGCAGKVAPQSAVTMGAGVIWIHAYDAVTTKAGQYVQGGGCTTVGVAGLVQSGGFGSFSKHYGTAAAGLLEAEVVTADGKIRIANACTNPDLFWALKGGGGGSFGVISKVTVRVHELPEFFGAAHLDIKAQSREAYRRLLRQFVAFYREQLFNDHWGEQAHIQGANVLQIRMAHQGLETQQVKAIWQPFLDWVARSPNDYSQLEDPILASIPARDLWNPDFMRKVAPGAFTQDPRPGATANDVWWTGDGGQAGQVLYGYESQWLPAKLLESGSQDALANALFECSRHWDVELHFNKGLAGAPADAIAAARDTATNPAVLDAFALAIIAGGTNRAIPGVPGHEPDYNKARSDAAQMHAAMSELRKVAPTPAAYVSESNYFENGWQQSFWGTNYSRLQAVKAKYDPAGLFFVHHGVGSEDWRDDGFAPAKP